jgi:hypothetical protein
MLTAKRTSVWRNRYEVVVDGQPVAQWQPRTWRTGGTFELAGRRYEVGSNVWVSRFTMTDELGLVVATERWTIATGGRSYEFRRASLWRSHEQLVADGQPVGFIRRVSMWRGDTVAELSALPMPVQVFALVVVLTMWDARNSAAAAAAVP